MALQESAEPVELHAGASSGVDVREQLRRRGAQTGAWVALPEAATPDVLESARQFVTDYAGKVVLVASTGPLRDAAAQIGWNFSGASGVRVDATADRHADPAAHLERAAELVACGEADGMVAGRTLSSATVIRAARRHLYEKGPANWISEAMYLRTPSNRVVAFGDVAVTPDPSSDQLSAIARDTSRQFTRLTGEPASVALLSFSTHGSAPLPQVTKVVEAVARLRDEVGMTVDGELQFDAAYSPRVAAIKAAGSSVAGRANVFIFPDLNSANIACKVAQFLGGAEVLALVPAGLTRPVVDVSRGSDIETITTSMTVCAALAAASESPAALR